MQGLDGLLKSEVDEEGRAKVKLNGNRSVLLESGL